MTKNRCLRVCRVVLFGLLALTARAFADNASNAQASIAATDPDGPAEGCVKGSDSSGFLRRLKDSYKSHLAWDGPDANAPPTKVVGGAEVPESIPPWPYATWNVGGTPAIGAENMYYSALMDALYCGRGGKKLKDSRFTIYGWLEPGGNISTSHTRFNYVNGSGGNYPTC